MTEAPLLPSVEENLLSFQRETYCSMISYVPMLIVRRGHNDY